MLDVLKTRWLISLIGALLLACLVWFIGPLIAIADHRPFEGEIARVLSILAILVFWVLANVFSLLRSRAANAKMVDNLAEGRADTSSLAHAEERAVLEERFKEALAVLKKTKLGRGGNRQFVYQLPWYTIIGPPGAGKTTALVNSGLKFPLVDQLGKHAIRGVGGTRNCDWWFTDEAVLIDTAGRYTTQDSREAVDSAAWRSFLELLKKARPRQPINGAIVVISLADFLNVPESERMAHARAVKARIQELTETLKIRFPVYLVLSKADLVAGFIEFFEDFAREDRDQVWGVTFPFDPKHKTSGKSDDLRQTVDEEFEVLAERLRARTLERIHKETDPQRRSLIFGFPSQFVSLTGPIRDFVVAAFGGSRLEDPALLRGIYFASGTQEGAPIDRLMGALAGSFGIDRQRLAAFKGSGRSFFLTNLLRDVIFREAGLVSSNRAYERRLLLTRGGSLAVALVALVVLGGLWTNSYIGNRREIGRIEERLDQFEAQPAVLAQPVRQADLAAVVPALDMLHSLLGEYAPEEAPAMLHLGLYQGDLLASQASAAYTRALNTLFLPRLLGRLEQQMRDNLSRPDYLLPALKVYLMLTRQGPLTTELARRWMVLDWSTAYPGSDHAGLREALQMHLEALLSSSLSLKYPVDAGLVEQVRQILRQLPPAERAYALIKEDRVVRQLADLRLTDLAGPAAVRVFVRPSGKPLTEGVPGLYSLIGFHTVLLPASLQAAQEVVQDSWILDREAGTAETPPKPTPGLLPDGVDLPRIRQLHRDLLTLYLNDYTAVWEAFLADLAIQPIQTRQQAIDVLNILSGPESPLRALLIAVGRQTALSQPPVLPGATTPLAGQATPAGAPNPLSRQADRLQGLIGGARAALGAGDDLEMARIIVEERFQRLQDLVRGDAGGGRRPIDETIRALDDVYVQLQRSGSGSEGLAAVTQSLRAIAGRVPAPVSAWLGAFTRDSSAVSREEQRKALAGNWQAKGQPFCQRALDGRYPLVAGAKPEVALDDFTQLFGPTGLFANFFDSHLRPYVDTSVQPWRWKEVDGGALGLSAASLAQFWRADAIREAFFGAGSATPAVRLEVIPRDLDSKVTKVTFALDEQEVVYSHGPLRPGRIQWPTAGGMSTTARVIFAPAEPGQTSSITWEGPWALFRLIESGRVERGESTERLNVTFSLGGRTASFSIRAGSVRNPLTLRELREFRCPSIP